MKMNIMPDAEIQDDARLVELSAEVDRDAFGCLVTRHQGMNSVLHILC